MEDFQNMTIVQLREEARVRGLKGMSSAKKQELIDALCKNPASKTMEDKQVTVTESAGTAAEKPAITPAASERSAITPETAPEKPAITPEAALERSSGASEKTVGAQNERRPGAYSYDRNQSSNKERQNGYGFRPNSDRSTVQRPQNSSYERVPANRTENESRINATRTAGEGMPAGEVVVQDVSANQRYDVDKFSMADMAHLDSGETREGILEVMPDFGFIRSDNFLSGPNDVYVSLAQIRRFGLRTGDIVCGNTKIRTQNEKFVALLYIKSVNGIPIEKFGRRKNFEELTPIYPNERIHLETNGCSLSMRMVDLISPIGKGQRGMIVSQPKTGKTTLLKQIAKSITENHPDMNLIILLIDERPEEVTDIKESIEGEKVKVIYSTFDELPEKHKKVSEMVIEHAKRLVEQKEDVVILLDSITRLARAYNLTVTASGRTLSGGLDPAALYMPKKFFGAARNMREGGSLTVLATALVDTGSRMDDVVFEEFKGTGNMELQLDRNLSERRIFPAIDLLKSSTRRDDLLLNKDEQEAVAIMRRMFNGARADENLESIIKTFQSTKNNAEFVETIRRSAPEKRG